MASTRKRKILQARRIVNRIIGPKWYGAESYLYNNGQIVQIGDTIDIFSLLFPNPEDFLVSNRVNDGGVKVRADDMRGKTILLYMLPLTSYYHYLYHYLSDEVLPLILAYNFRDCDFDFEVICVPVDRGPCYNHKRAKRRFHEWFSKMSWLAVPFTNRRACERIQRAFPYPYRVKTDPYWVILDPSGTVLLTREHVNSNVFSDYGIAELIPRVSKILPRLLDQQCPPRRHLSYPMQTEDQSVTKGIINLDQLFGSHYPGFLLAKDGTKVSLSSIKDKVVGFYFYNYESNRPLMEPLKKIYEEAIHRGYNFEIVQINLHSNDLFVCQNTPWLTLPHTESCRKRLVRLLRPYYIDIVDYDTVMQAECLLIVNERVPAYEDSFERYGAEIVHHFGIEAYPFTEQRVLELVYARRREEIKLQLIFAPGGPQLLRRGGGSYDQIPVSILWGKRVLVLFITHSGYKSSKFVADLESKYLEQNGDDMFEVVYISYDTDSSTFDDCTAEMPWLVHPYSFEFGELWRSKIFIGMDMDEGGHRGAIVAFNVDGEFVSENDYLKDYLDTTVYPFIRPNIYKGQGILADLHQKGQVTSGDCRLRDGYWGPA